MKIKHLFHPLRSMRLARERLVQYMAFRRAVELNEKKYRDDPRFCLDRVTEGFAQRRESEVDDYALLERICAAYIKAIHHEPEEAFAPSGWWRLVAAGSLGPVTHALRTRNIPVLQAMYRNFFRDPCGAGLVGLPVNMSRSYFDAEIKPNYKRLFLGDTLHQFDLWEELTERQFTVLDLESPIIGNPFGIVIDGVFIKTGAGYQHFYARRISELLDCSLRRNVVAEIGGGYGGMAYYFIRDNQGSTYIDFDVPETIALASYYLLRSFPKLKAILYGEEELTERTIEESDIILMPNFELSKLPSGSVNLSFNSHVLADMSVAAIRRYIDEILRTTSSFFLHLNRSAACLAISEYLNERSNHARLTYSCEAAWHGARSLQNDEREQIYEIC